LRGERIGFTGIKFRVRVRGRWGRRCLYTLYSAVGRMHGPNHSRNVVFQSGPLRAVHLQLGFWTVD